METKETIIGNWKKWIINALINTFIVMLITGIVVKWDKIDASVTKSDLNDAIRQIEKGQAKAIDKNTLEHQAILEQSKAYTDMRFNEVDNLGRMRFSTLEKMIRQSSEKQDLILNNLNEWIKLNEVRLRRLEDIEFKNVNDGNK